MSKIYVKSSQDGKVKYYGDISINKKRIRRFLGYDFKIAKVMMSKLEYELRFGSINKDQEIISITKGLLDFNKHLEKCAIGNRQLKTLIGKIRAFSNYCITNKINDINELSSGILQDFIDERYLSGLSPATLNKDIGTLKRIYQYFNLKGFINHNPATNIKRFKLKAKPIRRFNEIEIDKIYSYHGHFKDVYITLLETGIRIMDLKRLRPHHIEGNALNFYQLKTGEPLCIPLPDKIINIIQSRLKEEYLFKEIRFEKERRACLYELKRLLAPSNGVIMHCFRHTYAYKMLNKGVPKEILQTLLGHQSIRTTEIYANWVKKDELMKWI